MAKALIVYWSGTGNTEAMANAIAAGMKGAGAEVDVASIDAVTAASTLAYDKIAFGCPSMGDEVLEESEFDPFFSEVEDGLSGKKVALFGSFGWGDGQWMRDWHERTAAKGAAMMDEDLIQQDAPDEAACEAFGAAFAAL